VLERRARDNIVQSAEAHGMPGRRLDGNDAQAVYHAATQAVARARRGDGPSLLECRTFRWRGHVGPALDLDVGVQRRDELLEWRERDPIPRLRSELQARGLTSAELDRSWADAQNEVEDAVAFARASALPDPRDLGRYVFSPAERGAG
jgi:pyruvate dehydrogenase E1 component alpha subunit